MVLHSVTVPNAVTARVGNDYIPSMKRSPTACEDGLADVDTNDSNSRGAPKATKWQGGSSATIGRNSLVWWALGIRPYKDATFSGTQEWSKTTCLQRINPDKNVQAYVLPEWWGLQDTSPSLGLLVSAMAAGPIASCDGVGDFDRDMLMRTSRSDGITLKPTRPAVALDAVWVGDIFGPTALTSIETSTTRRGIVTPEKGGEVTFTFTDLAVGGGGGRSAFARWFYVLGWGSVQTLVPGRGSHADGANITFDDIASSAGAEPYGSYSGGDYVAWPEVHLATPSAGPASSRSHGGGSGGGGGGGGRASAFKPTAVELISFGPNNRTSTLAIPNMGATPGSYIFWRVAPVLPACGGLIVLGETSKFISASITRITGIACGGSEGTKVGLVGGPGESVTIEFAAQPAAEAIGNAGTQADAAVDGEGEEAEGGRSRGGGGGGRRYVVQSATCSISTAGTATLLLPSGNCV